MRFQVIALFDRPVFGEVSRTTADTEAERIFADKGPESAARLWLWRLSPAERAATIRLIVSAPVLDRYVVYEVYGGPVVEFERLNGWLSEVA
jgi:hypothetical protein